jgi:bacterioferritin-associated ferredoxin
MYICICRSVTDKKIKQAVCEGASTLDDLKHELGVASCCGKCACQANTVIKETMMKRCK